MKEHFYRPLECSTAYGVTVGHSVTFIHIAHMTVILNHNLRLYGSSSFIAEITFRWGVVNIRQHVCVSLVPPHYCRQVSPGPYMNVPLFNFVVFGARSCGMPLLFALTVPQQYICFLAKSSNNAGEEKLSMYNLLACPTFLVSSFTVAWVAVKCCALSVLPQVHFHVIRVSSRVTKFENFDAETLAFLWYILLENNPSFEGNNNFIYCQIFGRVVKFRKRAI